MSKNFSISSSSIQQDSLVDNDIETCSDLLGLFSRAKSRYFSTESSQHILGGMIIDELIKGNRDTMNYEMNEDTLNLIAEVQLLAGKSQHRSLDSKIEKVTRQLINHFPHIERTSEKFKRVVGDIIEEVSFDISSELDEGGERFMIVKEKLEERLDLEEGESYDESGMFEPKNMIENPRHEIDIKIGEVKSPQKSNCAPPLKARPQERQIKERPSKESSNKPSKKPSNLPSSKPSTMPSKKPSKIPSVNSSADQSRKNSLRGPAALLPAVASLMRLPPKKNPPKKSTTNKSKKNSRRSSVIKDTDPFLGGIGKLMQFVKEAKAERLGTEEMSAISASHRSSRAPTRHSRKASNEQVKILAEYLKKDYKGLKAIPV